MKPQLSLAMSLAVSFLAANSVSAKPTTFVVNDQKKRDVVSFTSDAPIEVIVGHTSAIKGKIDLDESLDLLKKPLDAEFTVDLTTIDTGIALRNEHMRNNFLETKRYPTAVFKVKSVSASPTVLQEGKKVTVKATGELSLHGNTVTREIPVDVTFSRTCADQGKFGKCDLIQIKSTFPVLFKDFNIQRPQIVFKKLADTVFVTIAATAYRTSSEPQQGVKKQEGAAKSAANATGSSKAK
jgi:polyisoprenoid-binding protein YceI